MKSFEDVGMTDVNDELAEVQEAEMVIPRNSKVY